MKSILNKFTTEHLFDAASSLLSHLRIKFSPYTKEPIQFEDLYEGATSSKPTKAIEDVLSKVAYTYYIGTIDSNTLSGHESDFDLTKPVEGNYQTMMVFAVDIKAGEQLTRTEIANLTRGFNRIALQLPVVLIIRNGEYISLATCERGQYLQQWREGEKLGKVSILRDINCTSPHRGHIDILESLGDKAYPTFDELYAHWLAVFSSELLTKKFYTELSEWFAWVIGSGKVKFPNDIRTTEDDQKYNHESTIRLITRLIFVWFLKQKKLVPEGLFDENYVRENFIENFDPHSTDSLFYDPEKSKYYRLILQNLFFAMLNRPIKAEGSDELSNRRFRGDHEHHGMRDGYNVNNLMRYRHEFREGGPEHLLQLANSCTPYLSGGLFECLDDKPNKMYYDGFSEHPSSLAQLSFPDYFFFGEEVGNDIDLSSWYDDKKKAHVKVRGILNILKSYNFTVEENTPLDQEVSLDPELLGKVFENLLASYNPETNTSARKQTGSFYTPRPIVQYMVDESLIAHLMRVCPEFSAETLRSLFSYTNDEVTFSEGERKKLIVALHSCKVLDPACGSGAFPMGILQQMVHVLRKLDPENKIWREFIIESALKADKEAYGVQDKEEREALRRDIEESFNRQVNDPDYARKLYLIENCIYGVDIQPIATQISRLRFFISLVAEQKPSTDAASNFGIRPLPNLEAKFVAANTLISLKKEANLFASNENLDEIKKTLSKLNHKIFLAKRNSEKTRLKEQIMEQQDALRHELLQIGNIGENTADTLAQWNMFDQNVSASFFDSEWMFGIDNGFDIVIGNPPYVSTKGITNDAKKMFEREFGFSDDLYSLFSFKGIALCAENGSVTFITPKTFWTTQTKKNLRELMLSRKIRYIFDTANPFESVMVDTCIWQVINTPYVSAEEHSIAFIDGCENLSSPLKFPPLSQSVYCNAQNLVIFKPTVFNLKVWSLYGDIVKRLYDKWWDKIKTSRDIEKNKNELEAYRKSLKPGDITLLGCITEGGQGLATANNGKYIAVRRKTKWANNIIVSRPKKLAEVISRYHPVIAGYIPGESVSTFLSRLSEQEIADLFDSLKAQYGRDIFGQGYLYKIVDDSEMADVNLLTEDEKENGIDSTKNVYVPYDKGDKDGNRWYLETPFAIAWSKENVHFLKTNSGKKGNGMPVVRNPQFYFREGFCWIDVNSTYLKARLKGVGVFDVLSMSLFTQMNLPDSYFVALINSDIISIYVDNFVNNTSHFQINDARQLPVVIPTPEILEEITDTVKYICEYKKNNIEKENTEEYEKVQIKLDNLIRSLYNIEK